MIVQADDLVALSTIVICPTSSSIPAASFHPEVEVEGKSTRVMCEMVGAVDRDRLGGPVAHLTLDELSRVSEALELVLGLV